jgi:hypothetical protein
MFVFEEKQSHPDCFVNTHSEVASQFGGCNSNVIGVVDGGSVMYITCYVSKDTHKDDKKAFAEAARVMIRKLNERIQSVEEQNSTNDSGDLREQPDHSIEAMRSLIGASFIATSSRMCSATMAAYLTRNRSQFHYSHDFQFVYLSDFYQDDIQDFSIDSTDDGTPFLKSSVANYIYRPNIFSELCL